MRDELDARIGAKQAENVEGEGAIAEMADRGRRINRAGANLDRFERIAAVPYGAEGFGTQYLPAEGIGDVERQTPIGEVLIGLFHPVALKRCWTDLERVAVYDVSDELHGRVLA